MMIGMTAHLLYYREVCGRVKAYRFGYNGAFYGYQTRGVTIDEWYVDGLSLTPWFYSRLFLSLPQLILSFVCAFLHHLQTLPLSL